MPVPHGGSLNVDEEHKGTGGSVSINSGEKQPLLESADNVMIAHIAGTIEVDEKPRLKK